MKKYFTLFLVLGLTNTFLIAQSFTTIPTDTIVATLANSTTAQYKMKQVNNTGGVLSLDIEVVKNTIPAGWDGMVCLQGICLGYIPAVGFTASQADLNANDTGYVRLTADPMTVGGGGELRIYVFDVNFPLDGDTLTWIINPAPTSVNEVNSNLSANISPNPSKDIVAIISESKMISIKIYSLKGELVHSIDGINSKELKVNVKQFPLGIYLVRIEGESNNFNSQKLIVQ